MTKRLLIMGAGTALGLGIAARFFTALTAPAVATPPAPSPDAVIQEKSVPPAPGDNRFRWTTAWTVNAPRLLDVNLSVTGEDLAWTDDLGIVRRITCATGHTLWRTTTPLPGTNRVVISPSGTVAAFSCMNPASTIVTFLDAQFGTEKSHPFTVDGAVWSTAFGDSESGAWIGSGERGLFSAQESPVKPRWRVAGVPQSLAIASAAPRLIVGTWQPAAVVGCSLTGKKACWEREEKDADRSCRVTVSRDGSRVVIVSTRGPHKTEPKITMCDGKSGMALWEAPLPADTMAPEVVLSENGTSLAVSYIRTSAMGRINDAVDAKLAYFDQDGHRCFRDKGSALFRPHAVAVSPDGSMLTVQSGLDTLFCLDRSGNFISKLCLPADSKTGVVPTIERAMASQDGRTLLLYRHDGKLTLLRANQ